MLCVNLPIISFCQVVKGENRSMHKMEDSLYDARKREVQSNRVLSDSIYVWLINFSYVVKDSVGRKEIIGAFLDHQEKSARKGLYNIESISSVAGDISSRYKRLFCALYLGSMGNNSVLKDSAYCRQLVSDIIEREEVGRCLVIDNNYNRPLLNKPDWQRMAARIVRKYGAWYADKCIVTAKRKWYKSSRLDWTELAKAHIRYYNKYVSIDGRTKFQLFSINNVLWNDVFLHVQDREVLLGAAAIQSVVVKLRPKDAAYVDTYANLLYRAGEKEQALEWQMKAVSINPEDRGNVTNLEKMRQGQPTWVVP